MKLKCLLLVLCAFACLIARAQEAYISKVYEYKPAPGQFINVLPEYEDGNTEADMIRKVEEKIVGQVGSTNYVCLGAWGGYVTFGFDHPLVNVRGEYDLLVYGNSFKSGEPQDGVQYGSPEPGIIYVSVDENGDGLPNDTWYEIQGSATEEANRSYEATYINAGADEDIPWTDNQGESGYVRRNQFHSQAYYPLWYTGNRCAFQGTLLAANISETGRAFMYDYGYADNWPNDDERAKIKLDWAIDADGQTVNLKYVDFIRVQTGVMVDWGVSGEMSTEVCGAEDLHPNASATGLDRSKAEKATKMLKNGRFCIVKDGKEYDVLGNRIR